LEKKGCKVAIFQGEKMVEIVIFRPWLQPAKLVHLPHKIGKENPNTNMNFLSLRILF
jgi:hypothetical protein